MPCQNSGCTQYNPCSYCEPISPCYQDCGCLNPTTWACVSHPGIYASLGVVDSMTGTQVLAAIAATIDTITVGIPPSGDDKYARISSSDTTSDYLNSKILVQSPIVKTIVSPSANEKIRLTIDYPALLDTDAGNILQIGTHGKLRVLATDVAADVNVVGGNGVDVTGTGPSSDPFVVSVNSSIQVAKSCYDGIWRTVSTLATGNANVVKVGGTPSYRINYNGSIEFLGSVTYSVSFADYTSASRKFTIPLFDLPTACLTAGEQTGTADLKAVTYIDNYNVLSPTMTQMYNYIIRKNAQHYYIEFQSAYYAGTVKTIVVNLEGVIVHPSL